MFFDATTNITQRRAIQERLGLEHRVEQPTFTEDVRLSSIDRITTYQQNEAYPCLRDGLPQVQTTPTLTAVEKLRTCVHRRRSLKGPDGSPLERLVLV